MGRLIDLLEALDRHLELGLEGGGWFQGYLRVETSSEEASEEEAGSQALDTTSFDEFRTRFEETSGEPKEIQVQLGRPGREPLADYAMRTTGIEVLVFPSLRMVDVGGLQEARLLCPSCGERSLFDAAFSVRPDPRFYCGGCGALTPLPETRFALEEKDDGMPFPCYRSVVVFDAEVEVTGEPVTAVVPSVLGIEAMEGALGCGLRAVVVRSPVRADP